MLKLRDAGLEPVKAEPYANKTSPECVATLIPSNSKICFVIAGVVTHTSSPQCELP